MRFYLSGQNLLTIAKGYKGYDPEGDVSSYYPVTQVLYIWCRYKNFKGKVMKRYRFIYTICVLLVFINISCSDFWMWKIRIRLTQTRDFIQNENAIREGATGVYSNLYMQVVGELAHTTIFDFYTGLALERNENTTIGAGGGLNADNSDILKFWSQLYTNVARAKRIFNRCEAEYG